ncbi:hypothetical protein F4703DRAFT_1819425 [Phycomyces blakesleeanus]
MESTVKTLHTDMIQEWEIDQAKLLRRLSEFTQQVSSLNNTLEEERRQFEKTKTSLLRELKIKDVTFDKKYQQTQEDFEQQIQELKHQLKKEQQEHQDDIQEWKSRHDVTLKTERTNNARRIYGFQERLSAKETEYAQLQNHLRQTQSEPSSPVGVGFSEISKDDRILYLEDTIAHMRKEHAAERKAWEAQLEMQETHSHHSHQSHHRQQQQQQQQRLDSTFNDNDTATSIAIAASREISPPQSLESPFLNIFSKKKKTLSLTGISSHETTRLNELTRQLKEAHAKKTDQMMLNFENEINRLKDLFINESRRVSMQHEARIQNLVAEHDQTIKDMVEEHSNAKEILKIEHQNQQEEFVEAQNQRLQRALRETEETWEERLKVANMSMSKDASEIQAHWETKRELMVAAHREEIERCRNELEVIKYRLRMAVEKLKESQSKASLLQDLQNSSTIEYTRLKFASKKAGLRLSKVNHTFITITMII